MKSKNIKVTLSLNKELYLLYRKYCENKGTIVSKQINLIIKDILVNDEDSVVTFDKRGEIKKIQN